MMIEKFLDYLLLEKNCSEKTVLNYGKDLRGFESFFKSLDNQLSWESVDSDMIRDWMESMMDRGNNATSVNRRLSALRSFYRFMMSRGYVESSPLYGIVGPRKAKPLPVFLKESEMNALLDSCSWDLSDFSSLTAYTILLMFYHTGVRVSELINMNDADVDMINDVVKVCGKGNKQRVVPFGAELKQAVADYIAMRDSSVAVNGCALFVTSGGERLKYHQVYNMVKTNLARVATVKKKSPHVLRHTFATAMLNNEAGLESVKKLLGHERLSTTEVYTHATFEKLKKVYAAAHPRS